MAMNTIFMLINRDEHTIQRLLDIWESAVKKTHTFLSDHDIIEIKPEVKRALIDISNYTAAAMTAASCKVSLA